MKSAMSRLPPLAAVRAFEAAGRHENFSRAAEELGLTQAAISYQIRQLEDRVGRPLFVREKGRVRLSDAGQRLLPAVTGGFAGIADAFDALREEDSEVLSITAAASVGGAWLSARIGRFQMRHPEIAVRMSLSNQLVDFADSSFDVALRFGKGEWPGLRADFLFRQHFTPICTPCFVEKHQLRQPEDLLRAQRLSPDDPLWREWFACAGLGTPPPSRGVVFDSQIQEASAILGGFGIALLTPLYWRSDLDSGRLVQPFEQLCLSSSSLWLVHPAGRVSVRKIERFREWLAEEVAADRERGPDEVWQKPASA
jgi:LysR family transcriptional regulator, glycine cleavage system transcriptional activator